MSEPKTKEETRFNTALRRVLRVSKAELQRREATYQAHRADKPKPGPKPKAQR